MTQGAIETTVAKVVEEVIATQEKANAEGVEGIVTGCRC